MNGRETADVVRGWLEGKPSLTFDEVAETLRVRGTEWLRPLPLARRRHTFTLAGFVGAVPMAAVVSNHQRWHGMDAGAVASELLVTVIRARAKVEVIVAGVGAAVTGRDRRALARLAEAHPGDSLRIRRAMAEANTRAAGLYPGLISEDCLVYSQDINGRGHEEASGPSRTVLTGLMNGVDVMALIRPFLDKQFGPGLWTMKQGASATSAGVLLRHASFSWSIQRKATFTRYVSSLCLAAAAPHLVRSMRLGSRSAKERRRGAPQASRASGGPHQNFSFFHNSEGSEGWPPTSTMRALLLAPRRHLTAHPMHASGTKRANSKTSGTRWGCTQVPGLSVQRDG